MHHQPVARQVFPEATPTVNVSLSEAKTVEDNPATSADDEQEEERVPTPPITEEAVPEVNVPVPDPPAHKVEVENLEAATTNTNEANDVVMAEVNVEPAPTMCSEPMMQLLLKYLWCSLTPLLLPLLPFRHQGPIQLSKHTAMAS